tara:strand:+ start:243 stop:1418 length:1176 start_codon:yes stop_codon:yes gene_type:complete
MATAVRVTNLIKRYSTDEGAVNAVREVSFNVEEGEFFTLLGPSGCGKSTTLRCIAGLEKADGGEIAIDDMVVVSADGNGYVPAHQRPIGMVFQSYAIWPHMNVFDNVAFPISRGKGKLPKAQVHDRVLEALSLVRLDGLENRPAPQLSGGQQQRLALARALVRQPKALLLDEPLSNLDAKLRDEMRVELKTLTERLNITTLFVTHDQLEALTLSDQIAVMRDGEIVQLGSPREIYSTPVSRFTAEFIGTTNLLEGTLISNSKGIAKVKTSQGEIRCAEAPGLNENDRVSIAIRPANIVVKSTKNTRDNGIKGKIETMVFLGDSIDCRVEAEGELIRAFVHPNQGLSRGDEVWLVAEPSDCKLLPYEAKFIEETSGSAAASTITQAPPTSAG